MDTSPDNRIAPATQVTPDLVIQSSQDLGYVTEAKYSLPADKDHWRDCAKQLLKYDDDLKGWWTTNELIDDHCIVLLLEYARTVAFIEYFKNWCAQNKESISKNLAIVEFTKSDNASPYLGLTLRHGNIETAELRSRLKYSVKVPTEDVVGTYSVRKFYDSPPVVEFTMSVIWMDILTPEVETVEFDKKLHGHPIRVKLDALTRELQKCFGQQSSGPREVEFPHRDWVKSAMDGFVQLDLAREMDLEKDDCDYLVIYHRIAAKDILEYFANHMRGTKPPRSKQLRLM
jgi:hypothetical protein